MKKADYIPTYRIQLVPDGHIRAQSISKPEEIIKSLQSLALSDREVLVGLYLNSRNQVIAHHVISMGTVCENFAHPREVFKPAIIKNACSVIIAHNHPSNRVDPSKADLDVTKRLKNAGMILGIKLIDHIIIAPSGKAYSIMKGRPIN
jgi:DNA repair protein RadC